MAKRDRGPLTEQDIEAYMAAARAKRPAKPKPRRLAPVPDQPNPTQSEPTNAVSRRRDTDPPDLGVAIRRVLSAGLDDSLGYARGGQVLWGLAIGQALHEGADPAALMAEFEISRATLYRFRDARQRALAMIDDGLHPDAMVAELRLTPPKELAAKAERRRAGPDPLRLARRLREALTEQHPDLVGAVEELLARLEDRRRE